MIRGLVALIRALIQQHRDIRCANGEHKWKAQRVWSTKVLEGDWWRRYDTIVHTCKNCGAEYRTIEPNEDAHGRPRTR